MLTYSTPTRVCHVNHCLFLQGVRLAQKFEALVLADNRFEIPYTRHLGKFHSFRHTNNVVTIIV